MPYHLPAMLLLLVRGPRFEEQGVDPADKGG